MEEGRPEFDKTKPSTRSPGQEALGDEFPFSHSSLGTPRISGGTDGFDGEIVVIGSLGKKASFGHTQKIHGEKTTRGE